jgi:hypothetical protein
MHKDWFLRGEPAPSHHLAHGWGKGCVEHHPTGSGHSYEVSDTTAFGNGWGCDGWQQANGAGNSEHLQKMGDQ